MKALLLAGLVALAADAPVPTDKLVAILVRSLAYDRSLEARAGDAVVVAVLSNHEPGSRTEAAAVMSAFKAFSSARVLGRPLKAVAVDWTGEDALDAVISANGVDAVFVCPGLELDLGAIAEVAHRRKVSTLTSVPDFVEKGIALGVTAEDGKPRLVVNLTASRAEGSQLSSELIGLARVIR